MRGPNSPLVSFVLTQLGVTTADLIFLMTSVLLQPVGLFLLPPRGYSVRKTGTLRHFRQAGSSTGNGYTSVCRAGGAQGGDLLSKDPERGKLLLSEVWKSKPRTCEFPRAPSRKPEWRSGAAQLTVVGAGASSHLQQQHLPGPEPERGWARLCPSSCLLMSHQGLSLAEPNSEPVGNGLGIVAIWFPTLAAQKSVAE